MWSGWFLRTAAPGLALVLVSAAVLCRSALAVPPGAIVGPALAPARWVQHRVTPGERLREIAARYEVTVGELIEWNKLNKKRPLIRAGKFVRVKTEKQVPQRVRTQIRVQKGDSWHLLARRYDVPVAHLRKRWNRGKDKLKVGDRLVVFVDEDLAAAAPGVDMPGADRPAEATVAAAASAASRVSVGPIAVESKPEPLTIAGFPIVEVPPSSRAIGRPNRGRIRRSRAMPDNPSLYTVRNPDRAHATSLTAMTLQRAFANFRGRTGFSRELVILDISQKGGGRLRPHKSHRAGRDVDLRLPLAPAVPDGTVPIKPTQVDWDMTWKLIEALIETGEVRYIFLSRSRQRRLYPAALRAGASPSYLAKHLQFPGRERKQTVRHSKGHDKHMHIRFNCAADSKRCRD